MDVFNEGQIQRVRNVSFASHSEPKEFDQFELVYDRKLPSPILGHYYELPDFPTSYIPPTTLDTSLLHIPVYAHLKIYDLKPVQRPKIPSILSTLYSQFPEVIRKSSREIFLTARTSEENTTLSALHSIQEQNEK